MATGSYLSIITLNINGLNAPTKRQRLAEWIQKQDPYICCLQETRDITLPTKVHLIKATVFPVVMYACESWTIKKAEHRGIDAFELWCWRRLLSVPWTARISNK